MFILQGTSSPNIVEESMMGWRENECTQNTGAETLRKYSIWESEKGN
jgi:hypothetical protein